MTLLIEIIADLFDFIFSCAKSEDNGTSKISSCLNKRIELLIDLNSSIGKGSVGQVVAITDSEFVFAEFYPALNAHSHLEFQYPHSELPYRH